MDFFTLLAQPARAKAFDPRRPVSHEVQDKLIRAAEWAPTVHGRPSWHLEVVRTDEARQRISAGAAARRRLEAGGVVFVFCADHRTAAMLSPSHSLRYALLDVAVAAYAAHLAATALGLASDWVANFEPRQLAAALDLKPDLEPVVLLAVGYEE